MSTVSKLFEACQKGDLQSVTNLLKPLGPLAGQFNIRNANNYKRTPLIYASMRGHLHVVTYLIRGNAEIDAVDDHGRNASVYAAINGHTTVVDIIDKSRVDITGLLVEDVIRAGNFKMLGPFLSKLPHIDERTTQVISINIAIEVEALLRYSISGLDCAYACLYV